MEHLEELKYKAEVVIKMFAETKNVNLDYDEKSIKYLDSYINEIREEFRQEIIDKLISIFGSFLGETIRLNHGGNWEIINNEFAVRVNDKVAVFPFSKVRKQFKNGSEDSILSFYQLAPTLDKLKK
ncbi:MAG TPA: hypothetical protein VK892_14395 [Pyrinomonadaceae bacterium]|nr:hypothetical protein [Pyrinomonadaceae bacterium]